jgi:geranyl-CoA carboxylase alpha subunit
MKRMERRAMSDTPFRRILIANRGEIALRIIRTARRLGYETVAVHSSADANALHVRAADQACLIGGATPAASYLNIDAIVEAARRSGADAVHPGYGFLAENTAFAAACHKAGLVFIGPSPEAIELMGDKARAKDVMRRAGVPCVPGYQGDDQSEQRLAAEAERIGFPVMIKASAGGGGRGMRRARGKDELIPLIRSARSEAEHAFGDPTLLIERAIEGARHVEIQVFGDRHGNAIHLGERDCSVQRRHQKLIEESPSPAVAPDLRAAMGAAAVAAVQAVGYEGAGTLEFLLDEAGAFFFLEMNTRLQVEHPVTEAVTGLDLVELQLRIACGEKLPLSQDEVRFCGHAIEARLCAEDPDLDFLPQSGRIGLWRPPAALRVDHAIADGSDILPFYDSMVAKLIAHGATREEARRKLVHGLAETVALGVTTNAGFLQRCLGHPVFVAGAATTDFIDTHRAGLRERRDASRPPQAALAALALHVTERLVGQFALGRTLAPTFTLPLRFRLGGQTIACDLRRSRSGSFSITLDAQSVEAEITEVTEETLRFRCAGVEDAMTYVRSGGDLYLCWNGETVHIEDESRAAAVKPGNAGGDGQLRAAMSGRVAAVLVKAGDAVDVGQPLLVLEAMKMEHVHSAPVAGTVALVHVEKNQQIAANKIVVEIDPARSKAAHEQVKHGKRDSA